MRTDGECACASVTLTLRPFISSPVRFNLLPPGKETAVATPTLRSSVNMPPAQSMPQASGLRRNRSLSAVGTSGVSDSVAGMVQRVSRASSTVNEDGLHQSSNSRLQCGGGSGSSARAARQSSRAVDNADGLHGSSSGARKGLASSAHGSHGKRVLPAAPVGSLAASIASGRSKRKKPANNPPPVPTTTAYRELHSRNFTILRKQVPASTCAMLRESAAREAYKPILGDKLRLYAAHATSAPVVSRLIDQVLNIRVGVKVDSIRGGRLWLKCGWTIHEGKLVRVS
jgi:hypothetical protein